MSFNEEVPAGPRTGRHDMAEQLYRRIVDENRNAWMTRLEFIDSSGGTLAGLWVRWQIGRCGKDGSRTASSGGSGRWLLSIRPAQPEA
jgi:hypothetical protein